MPFESEKQKRAMYAAAKGKSTIGIPKKVAEKFIKHNPYTKRKSTGAKKHT